MDTNDSKLLKNIDFLQVYMSFLPLSDSETFNNIYLPS